MTGILDKFYIEHGIYGARVMTRSNQLTPHCMSEGDIDTHIQLLKEDLDACATEMKRLLKLDQSGSTFTGWPKIADDIF